MGKISNANYSKAHSVPKEETIRNTCSLDDTPPIYYDSEPSSQPPQYPDHRHSQSQVEPTSSTRLQAPTKPPHQHRNSAPASTIHAILASPHVDLDAERRANRKSKTLRQRWRDFKERNFHDDHDLSYESTSGPEWNVKGASLKGGLVTPYRMQGEK